MTTRQTIPVTPAAATATSFTPVGLGLLQRNCAKPVKPSSSMVSVSNDSLQRQRGDNGTSPALSPATARGFAHDFSQIPSSIQHAEQRKETSPTAAQYKTWGSAGGLAGLTLNVTFSVSDTTATSLQAIQTVMCTGGPQRVGTYSWKKGVQTWDAFVDGGKNSPYVTILGNPPAHPTKPYYLTAAEVAGQVAFAGKAGTIQITDVPGAAALWDEVHFETAIVAVDGRAAGKDKIQNAFKWGWTGKGTKPDIGKGTEIAGRSSGINVIGSNVTPEFKNIVRHDYSAYDIA